MLETVRDHVHLRLRLLQRDAGFEPRPHPKLIGGFADCELAGVELLSKWDPQLVTPFATGLVEREAGGHDPHDRVWPAVDLDRPAEDSRITAVATFPELLANDSRSGRAWLIFAFQEGPPNYRLDTQQREEGSRYWRAHHFYRIAVVGEPVRGPVDFRGQVLEDPILSAPVQEICGLRPALLPFAIDRRDQDNLVRSVIGERMQQGDIRHAENSCVGSDSEGQCKDDDRREARSSAN